MVHSFASTGRTLSPSAVALCYLQSPAYLQTPVLITHPRQSGPGPATVSRGGHTSCIS